MTRITVYLDNTILELLRAESEATGKGYQTLINELIFLAVRRHLLMISEDVGDGRTRKKRPGRRNLGLELLEGIRQMQAGQAARVHRFAVIMTPRRRAKSG
jgi:hypothetical protein